MRKILFSCGNVVCASCVCASVCEWKTKIAIAIICTTPTGDNEKENPLARWAHNKYVWECFRLATSLSSNASFEVRRCIVENIVYCNTVDDKSGYFAHTKPVHCSGHFMKCITIHTGAHFVPYFWHFSKPTGSILVTWQTGRTGKKIHIHTLTHIHK